MKNMIFYRVKHGKGFINVVMNSINRLYTDKNYKKYRYYTVEEYIINELSIYAVRDNSDSLVYSIYGSKLVFELIVQDLKNQC